LKEGGSITPISQGGREIGRIGQTHGNSSPPRYVGVGITEKEEGQGKLSQGSLGTIAKGEWWSLRVCQLLEHDWAKGDRLRQNKGKR